MKMINILGKKKTKTFTNQEDLKEFIVVNGGDEDAVNEICHLMKKGQSEVYWCINPFASEIYDDEIMMWNTCENSLNAMYAVACDEI